MESNIATGTVGEATKQRARKALDRVLNKDPNIQVEYKKSSEAPQQPQHVQQPQQTQQPVVTVKPPSVPDVVDTSVDKIDFNFEPSKEEVKEEVKVEPKQETVLPKDYNPQDEVDSVIDPKGTTAENFKKLRTKLKALNQTTKEKEEELTQLKSKLQEYESGLIIPDEHQKMMQRISELEVYEKMYNIKGSPAYQEKITKPISTEMEKLKDIAKDYGVGDEVLNAVLNASTRPEQNRILSNYFDEIAAVEVKSILNNINKIKGEAKELEADPDRLHSRIQEESKAILENKRKGQLERIAATSKDAWVESLTELRSSDDYPEFTFREGDNTHNEKLVRPMLSKAATEYGKIVNALAKSGLEELPRDLSKAISRMTKLAHASAYWKYTAQQQMKEIEDLKASISRDSVINRPSMNGGVSSSKQSSSSSSSSPAMRALSRVTTR